VNQISNLSGSKKFFNDKGTDIEPCEENRLTTVMPFYTFDGVPASKGIKSNNAFFFRGSEPVKLEYKAFGKYRIGMIFHGKYYETSGVSKGEMQYFSPEEKFINHSYTRPKADN
jgi:hypothetical protein